MTDAPNVLANAARLLALQRLELLHTPPEEAFDRITRMVAKILHIPISVISLVTDSEQFFKSAVGLQEPWATTRTTPLSHSLCQHTMTRATSLVISDARHHPLAKDNLAVSEMGVVAYAGVPLQTRDGDVLGVLCAVDVQPRLWSAEELSILYDFAAMTMTEIELRREVIQRRETEAAMRLERDFTNSVLDTADCLMVISDMQGYILRFNHACERLTGYTAKEIEGKPLGSLFLLPEEQADVAAVFQQLVETRQPSNHENHWVGRNGTAYLIEWRNSIVLDQQGQPLYFIGSGVNVTERRRDEQEIKRINQQLTLRVAELQQHTHELRLVSEMRDMLQVCVTMDEACTVVAGMLAQLLPDFQGVLALFDHKHDCFTIGAQWHTTGRRGFERNECWAIRRGRLHAWEDGQAVLRCAHVHQDSTAALCVPLHAHNGNIGLLSIEQHDGDTPIENRQRLIETVAGQLELVLANLQLQATLQARMLG